VLKKEIWKFIILYILHYNKRGARGSAVG